MTKMHVLGFVLLMFHVYMTVNSLISVSGWGFNVYSVVTLLTAAMSGLTVFFLLYAMRP